VEGASGASPPAVAVLRLREVQHPVDKAGPGAGREVTGRRHLVRLSPARIELVVNALRGRRRLDCRRTLRRARYDREEAENGMVVNLANVVSVRVSMKDSSTTGQYL
jgi:hypothetical protein